MARGRRDGGGLQRRRPSRDPLPLVLVVCEGKITEPQYIDGFRLEHGATTVRVRIESPGGDPKALVARAVELRDAAARDAQRARDPFLKYDEVWCLFDVDEHARLETARQDASRLGILLAISNPCFELWLLLHFSGQTAHLIQRTPAALSSAIYRTTTSTSATKTCAPATRRR